MWISKEEYKLLNKRIANLEESVRKLYEESIIYYNIDKNNYGVRTNKTPYGWPYIGEYHNYMKINQIVKLLLENLNFVVTNVPDENARKTVITQKKEEKKDEV